MLQDYQSKDHCYFGLVRHELLDRIPKGPHKILEIGAGDGSTGAALKQQDKAVEVVGVELVMAAAEKAAKNIDHVLQGDIEKPSISYPKGYFHYYYAAMYSNIS